MGKTLGANRENQFNAFRIRSFITLFVIDGERASPKSSDC
jgi:hypothetical protein